MPTLTPSQLLTSLNKPLQKLYVLHGEEDLLRIESLDALRVAAKQQGYVNVEKHQIDSTAFDWQGLLAEASSAGLFADLKLLEIHLPSGKPGKVGGEALQTLAQQLPEDTCTVVVLPKLEKAQQQAKWFTALAKEACVVEAKAVGVNALPEWIRSRLLKHHLGIADDALALFVDLVEGNLLAAKQEIDKLALLHPEGYTVQWEDAQQAVANVARFDVFQLSSAWLAGDAKRVTRLMDGLETEDEEPVLLVWALAEDIRMLLRLAAALKEGKTVGAVRNELRLWGNKQTLAPAALKRLKPRALIQALQTCAQIDRQIKGAEDGKAWTTFKHLVMKLAA